MKVSVITVCFNSADTIADAVNSVASQSFDNIEYIIVDGASTDGTSKIVEQFASTVDTFVSEPDRGIYDAMNKAVALASGDVIGILNSDDFFEATDIIESVVEAFEKTPDSDLVFGDVVFVSEEDTSSITRFYSSRRFRPWKLRFGWMPPHPATFVRKDVYEKFGEYSLDYKISADYEKFVRWLLVEKLNFARIDRVLVRMRQGGVSTSGVMSNIVLNREIVKACRSNGVYTNGLFLLAKIPFKLLELVRRPRTNTNE